MIEKHRTLVSQLRRLAEERPDMDAYTYVEDRGSGARTITWSELDSRARATATKLAEYGKPGDRALLVLPSGPDFLFSFLGCLYAGIIAVPSPEPARPRDIERLSRILASAGAAVVVASRALLDASAGVGLDLPARFAPDEVSLDDAATWKAPPIDADDAAFLQYTSGSTGDPKGVIVSHGNIMANEEMIRRAFGHGPSTVVVGWLPHFHDMGLIGNILQPLCLGARAVLMSPESFMRDPLRWLRTISAYRATTSGGPNFAYELCVRRHARLGQKLDIDLSCWDLAYVGAEPVRAHTMREFARTFADYGFDRRSLFPCYGLAEATLFVTGGEKGTGAEEMEQSLGEKVRTVVGCGKAGANLEVEVVDTRTMAACPDGVEGELFVAGPSVCGGYWRRDADSAQVFGQELPGRGGSFHRTGDLAMRRGERFFVTGRVRDCIILRGQNYHPQDVEAAAEAVGPEVRPGQSAAFAFECGEQERVGLVCEVGDLASPVEALCERVRSAVGDAIGIRIDVVVLIERRSLPKTTSGKVERQTTRRAFLDGNLQCVGSSSLIASDELWARSLAKSSARNGGELAPSPA